MIDTLKPVIILTISVSKRIPWYQLTNVVFISGRSVRGLAGIFYSISVMFWIGLGLAWFAALISTIQADIERVFNRKIETAEEELDGKSSPEEVR